LHIFHADIYRSHDIHVCFFIFSNTNHTYYHWWHPIMNQHCNMWRLQCQNNEVPKMICWTKKRTTKTLDHIVVVEFCSSNLVAIVFTTIFSFGVSLQCCFQQEMAGCRFKIGQ
jgi:hypothetical protein